MDGAEKLAHISYEIIHILDWAVSPINDETLCKLYMQPCAGNHTFMPGGDECVDPEGNTAQPWMYTICGVYQIDVGVIGLVLINYICIY